MKKFQYDENMQEDDYYKSRSEKKRESTSLQEKGEELVKLSIAQLKNDNVHEDIISAIAEYKKISSKEAKRRQMQYIGKLMREYWEED